MAPKAKQLIQLVEGKTLLREAPLVRDLILHLYNFDIDDPKNKRKSTDIPDECPICQRYQTVAKFAKLVRDVRYRSAPVLNQYPKYNFWIVQDEIKRRRVVHIKKGLNQDYILRNLKIMEKLKKARERRETVIRLSTTTSPPSKEEIVERLVNGQIESVRQGCIKGYCSRKHIRVKKRELIPRRSGYKPNYRGIQHIFGQSVVEIYLEDFYNASKTWYRLWQDKGKKKEFLNDVLKQIILCNYQHKDYCRPGRDEEINAGKDVLRQLTADGKFTWF